MTKLQSLKRRSKWRLKVRAELDESVKTGVKLYGVRRDGKYVIKSSDGDVVIKRSVKGAILAERAEAV